MQGPIPDEEQVDEFPSNPLLQALHLGPSRNEVLLDAGVSAPRRGDVVAYRTRRSLRVRYLVTSLALIILLAGLITTVWYVRRPTPADRFERLLYVAKQSIAKRIDNEVARELFKNSFYYDILNTDSVVSPFRASVDYVVPNAVMQFTFDYRKGEWLCMSARQQSREGYKTTVRARRRKRITDAASKSGALARHSRSP